MRGWGRMIACKWRKELWVTRQKLEEVCIILVEDIHNATLQEEVAKLEMMVR
jgi:hypothetical protein